MWDIVSVACPVVWCKQWGTWVVGNQIERLSLAGRTCNLAFTVNVTMSSLSAVFLLWMWQCPHWVQCFYCECDNVLIECSVFTVNVKMSSLSAVFLLWMWQCPHWVQCFYCECDNVLIECSVFTVNVTMSSLSAVFLLWMWQCPH